LAICLLFLSSSVYAATTWRLDATPIQLTDPWSSFSVTFNDDNDDRIVDINDVVDFSGVWLPYYLPDLVALPDLFYVGKDPYPIIDFSGGLRIDAPTPYENLAWVFGGYFVSYHNRNNWTYTAQSVVPIPGTVWLLSSGLVGLVWFRRKYRK
jgi:hypothetical protein